MAGDRYHDVDMGEERPSRIRSTVTAVRKQRGRGFDETDLNDNVLSQNFDSIQATGKAHGAQKSVEGWVIFVKNVHEEATDDEVSDIFSEYGNVKNLYLNLDRRTGFAKGYAIVEYNAQEEAQAAIDALNGETFLEQTLTVGWCFVTSPARRGRR